MENSDENCIASSDFKVHDLIVKKNILFKILDCRYAEEFGTDDSFHLEGAINVGDRSKENPVENFYRENDSCLLIVHCEFSGKRGPNL